VQAVKTKDKITTKIIYRILTPFIKKPTFEKWVDVQNYERYESSPAIEQKPYLLASTPNG